MVCSVTLYLYRRWVNRQDSLLAALSCLGSFLLLRILRYRGLGAYLFQVMSSLAVLGYALHWCSSLRLGTTFKANPGCNFLRLIPSKREISGHLFCLSQRWHRILPPDSKAGRETGSARQMTQNTML